jgi:hypothetical protein
VLDKCRNIFQALSKRWWQDGEDIKAIVQVTAKLPTSDHLDEISTACRDQSDVYIVRATAPQAVNPALATHATTSAAARGECHPTSSRNSVPLSAISKRPIFWAMAPVKALFSRLNGSLSHRSSGMAAQLSFMKARPTRQLAL